MPYIDLEGDPTVGELPENKYCYSKGLDGGADYNIYLRAQGRFAFALAYLNEDNSLRFYQDNDGFGFAFSIKENAVLDVALEKACEGISYFTSYDYENEDLFPGTAQDNDFREHAYENGAFDLMVDLVNLAVASGDYFPGTLVNEVVEVDADDGSVDISDQRIAEAQEYISKIELDVGSGVTVTTRMAKDKRVYATASRTPESADDTVFAEYKEINDVLRLKTDGLSSSGTTVKLGAEYAGLYVYDGSLQYLGRASEQLPLAAKYYLSSAELELDDEDIPDATNCVEPIEPAEDGGTEGAGNATDNPNTGGDDYPENVNANPNTGR